MVRLAEVSRDRKQWSILWAQWMEQPSFLWVIIWLGMFDQATHESKMLLSKSTRDDER
jgi:hypothetical protein